MKNPFHPRVAPVFLLVASAFAVLALQSDPEFDPLGEHHQPPALIRTQVEFVEVPHATLTRLLAEPRVGADDTLLRKAVAELTEQGGASVVETMLVIARSGQKATAESVKEFIYPTEYEPADFFNPPAVDADRENPVVSENHRAIGPTPTAFETRNLGSTLEIEPTLGENNILIDLRFLPEIVHHTGNLTWAEWKDERGDASVRMPTFHSSRLNTSTTLMAGQPQLVGTLSTKGPDGMPDPTRKLMVFVRCDVLIVGR